MKKELNILIVASLVWCAGIILAPLFAGTVVSDTLFRFYSAVCHQFESRSFHIHGNPLAVCIRCFSIYSAFVLTMIAIRTVPKLRSKDLAVIPLLMYAMVPMCIDGLLSLFGVIPSTTFSRVVTGSLFGGGVALLLHSPLSEIIHLIFFKKRIPHEIKT